MLHIYSDPSANDCIMGVVSGIPTSGSNTIHGFSLKGKVVELFGIGYSPKENTCFDFEIR